MIKTSKLPPSVVELDGDFNHEFIHTRGIRLHAVTAGHTSDPLVVLIHGAFGGWFDYRHVIAPLARQGFHVAALDLRGFGMSDKPPIEVSQDIRTATGDISGAIQALGHDDAFIVGADTGASIAWSTAIDHPDRVRGIVSISGAYPVDMRRAMAARPWDFFWLIARAGLCRLPAGFLAQVHRNPTKLYAKELALNTGPEFRGKAFSEALEVRVQAASIGNVARGIIWNHRLFTAVVPLRWLDALADAPVLFLHANQGLWRPVIRRARQRTTGGFDHRIIAGAKNLPMLEQPARCADVVGAWMTAQLAARQQ